MLKLHKPQKR